MVPDGASRGKCGKPDEFEKKPAIAICTLLVQSVLAPGKARKSVWSIWYRQGLTTFFCKGEAGHIPNRLQRRKHHGDACLPQFSWLPVLCVNGVAGPHEFQSWWLAKNQQHQQRRCPVSIGLVLAVVFHKLLRKAKLRCRNVWSCCKYCSKVRLSTSV